MGGLGCQGTYTVEIMHNNFPMGIIVLGGSCPSKRINCPWDNSTTEVMV